MHVAVPPGAGLGRLHQTVDAFQHGIGGPDADVVENAPPVPLPWTAWPSRSPSAPKQPPSRPRRYGASAGEPRRRAGAKGAAGVRCSHFCRHRDCISVHVGTPVRITSCPRSLGVVWIELRHQGCLVLGAVTTCHGVPAESARQGDRLRRTSTSAVPAHHPGWAAGRTGLERAWSAKEPP